MFTRQALYFLPSVKGFFFGWLSRTHSGQTLPLKAAQSPHLIKAATMAYWRKCVGIEPTDPP
jgi:hypothetical protein